MRLLIHKTFYLKTGDKQTLQPDDAFYSELVTAILKYAKSLNFLPAHMEKACERFLFAKQYGGRIELADFFTGEERKPLLSSWDIEQIKKREQRLLEGGNNGH